MIYLDANATAPLHPAARAAILAALDEGPANASSIHAAGQRARARLDGAREQCAAALGCTPRELIFTSGGTESDALAIRGAQPGRVVITAVEHPAVIGACKQSGAPVVRVGVDGNGRLDLDALDAALPGAGLCSAMLANNETGVIFPVEEIALRCRARGVPLHVDAVQAVGKLPVRLSELGADYVAVSGHKLGGPHGIGLLYVRRGARLTPLQIGGHQEEGRRAGTENLAGAVGLATALRAAAAELPETAQRTAALRDRLEAAVRAVPGARVHGQGSPRLPNTICATFDGCESEALLAALDLEGICASGGSACSSGTLEPSPVLLAMGVEPSRARGALRFSLWSGNTEAEIDRTAALLTGIVARVSCRG